MPACKKHSRWFYINLRRQIDMDEGGGQNKARRSKMAKRKRHHKRALPPRTKTGRFRKRRRSK